MWTRALLVAGLSSSTRAMSASARRTVLVTGANKGIGLQISKKILSDVGDSAVLLGCRDVSRGENAVAEIVAENPDANGRVSVLALDVTSDESVAAAAAAIDGRLHGLVNNAGVGFGRSVEETLAPNYYGAKRVCGALIDKVADGGRVVNIGSASAPNFVARLDDASLFASPATTLDALEATLATYSAAPDYDGVAYGLSKASLHVLTVNLAAEHPRLRVNTCSPGYVLTDLTAGMGATKRPADSNCHVAPLYLLFDDAATETGWYYGSDAVRSPLDRYRGPGEPPYLGD